MSGQAVGTQLIILLFRFVLVIHGTFALAQHEPGQWVDDMYLVNLTGKFPFEKVFLNEKNNIHSTIPNIATVVDFPVPSRNRSIALWSYWRNNALYTLASGSDGKDEDGTLITRHVFAKWEEDKWHFSGYYKADPTVLLRAVPCDNDRFITVSNKDLRGDNRADRTPFSRMSVRSGRNEVIFDTSIDHGMEELQKFMLDRTCFDLAFNSDFIVTNNHLTLVNKKTGLYWVFSLEKASLVKSGMIFKLVTPKMIARGGFSDAILCVNPEKNGTVLLSAQEEEAFITETRDATREIKELMENNNKNNNKLSIDEIKKIIQKQSEELAERNPYIVWYRIYPESGRLERLSIPPEGAAIHREGGTNDSWQPMPDGSVKMGPLNIKQSEKVESETKR